VKATVPDAMTAAERLSEIAEILAVGYQRHLAAECKAAVQPRNSQVRLAAAGAAEAPCRARVHSPQSLEQPA
jgi:hypothetical protein